MLHLQHRNSIMWNVEFVVGVEGEQARAEGKCVLRAEDKYYNHTRSKSPLSPWSTPYFL